MDKPDGKTSSQFTNRRKSINRRDKIPQPVTTEGKLRKALTTLLETTFNGNKQQFAAAIGFSDKFVSRQLRCAERFRTYDTLPRLKPNAKG